jgi:hypothetical protein
LIGAADRIVDTLPIADIRVAGEAAHQTCRKYATGEIAFGRVAQEPSREFASDRRHSGVGDVRIGTGPNDLTNDHCSLSRVSGIL